MTALWAQKRDEIEAISGKMRAHAETLDDAKRIDLIVNLAARLAQNIPAGQRRQWLAKLNKNDAQTTNGKVDA